MKIIAFDTSTEFCSVALWVDGTIVTRECHAGSRHSELLLPLLDELFTETGKRLTDFSGIAFGVGPGSFTGLRIACGVAQGLSLGTGLPVIGVGTLLAVAEASQAQRAVCCLDARMGEVYHAAFEKLGAEWGVVHEPSLCKPQDVPALSDGDWVGCGNGFAVQRDALMKRYFGKVNEIKADLIPHAREIASLSVPMFKRGLGTDAASAVPLYIRDKVALRMDER